MMKNFVVKHLYVFILVFTAFPVKAQTGADELGNWMMYFGTNRFSDKLSIHTEVQWRNHNVMPNIEQLLLRTGLNYHINSQFILTGGYGYISSHPYDKEHVQTLSTEHRIFEQLIIKNNLSRLFFEHRYRYEQRWVNSNFRQRLRYRLMVSIPLNSPTIEPGSVFIGLYDELFVNPERGNVFDRNRLYGALGYQVSKTTSVQVGVLRQTVKAYSKDYLQFALFFNPDLRKEE